MGYVEIQPEQSSFWEKVGDWAIHLITCIIDAVTKGIT